MKNSPPEALQNQVAAMTYISESEAPLDILQWPDVSDRAAARSRIATLHKVAQDALQTIAESDFLQSITQMADPADAVMVAYADSFNALFELLHKSLKGLEVVKAGTAPVQVYITGFDDDGCTAIHTTAVET